MRPGSGQANQRRTTSDRICMKDLLSLKDWVKGQLGSQTSCFFMLECGDQPANQRRTSSSCVCKNIWVSFVYNRVGQRTDSESQTSCPDGNIVDVRGLDLTYGAVYLHPKLISFTEYIFYERSFGKDSSFKRTCGLEAQHEKT